MGFDVFGLFQADVFCIARGADNISVAVRVGIDYLLNAFCFILHGFVSNAQKEIGLAYLLAKGYFFCFRSIRL